MKKIKLKKGYIAGVLTLLLVIAALGLPTAYGAGAIDTQAECSITLQVGEGTQFKEDLSELTLQASLYRVADISETGLYTVRGAYEELNLSDIDDTTTAAVWQEKSETADRIVEDKMMTPDYSLEMAGGVGSLTGITQGMYLIKVAAVQNDLYEYSFIPFLISVPNNLYYQTEPQDDSWVYDVTADIKPEQTPRKGAIEIVKTVSVHNANMGTAMFVFQSDAVDMNGENVYSNVAGISFDAAGTKSIRVDGIPAGSTVTVTEIYSGSSYELVSGAPTQTAVIAADDAQTVEFVNTYNEQLIPGTGTVNHFDKDDTDAQNNGWKWTQRSLSEDSALVTETEAETAENVETEETEETTQTPQE